VVEIVTDRLRWRRADPADLDGLHALVSDFEVVKNTATWPSPPDRRFTESRCVPFDLHKGLVGHVFCEDVLVGAIGVSQGATGADMGYMFGREHWGRGYATEIGRALIDAAFARYDWPAISACVFDDNPTSGRVLAKLGFTETGRCAGPCAARGRDLAMRTYRLDRR